MSPERWQRIEEVYHSALELAPDQRAAFLAEICGDDDELRREVESLLRHGDSQEALVDRPAWEAAGELLDTHTMDQTRYLAGHRLSHYEIVEKLGEGGMGVVYKARDSHLKRFVALKVLPPEKVADPERKHRFVQEARSASALNHPNIVTVYDIDQAEGVDFIAMEYIEGSTLQAIIRKARMAVPEAVDVALQIAGALDAAHRHGIIHRDLKPANIMLTADRLVKILDFGLAKLRQPSHGDEAAEAHSLTTREGVVIGTAAYMSPEQARGENVDHRSDISSFGAFLYEMLNSRPAFQRPSHVATLAAVLRDEPPPLRVLVPEASPELDEVVERCLRKDAGDRRFGLRRYEPGA